jgi:hypothetical protein
LSTEALTGSAVRSLSIPGRERFVFPDWLPVFGRENCAPVVASVEMDRGTMPNIRRAGSDLSDLAEKYEAYQIYAHAEQHLIDFGTPRFRVLTIVDGGEAKVRNVARTAFEMCDGTAPDRFLVTSLERVVAGDPFEIEWLNAAEQAVKLAV